MLKGTFTALITPFLQDGSLDYARFAELIERQKKTGVAGIVACGTSGESPTLSYQENIELICQAVEFAGADLIVVGGTGANNTSEAIHMTTKALKCGMQYSLQVAPYYNKPSQEGFYQHFKAIAEEVPEVKHLIYNVPGRTGKNISSETILRLAKIENIIGVKEASGDVEQMMTILRDKPDDFTLLLGDDSLAVPLISIGAEGVISVAANLFPAKVAAMVNAALISDFNNATKLHYQLLDFFRACFLPNNPIAIKTIMAFEGFIEEVFRLPLCSANKEDQLKLKDIIKITKQKLN
jgi:4-hydroxy-tetrahydrodipicolinate synthase